MKCRNLLVEFSGTLRSFQFYSRSDYIRTMLDYNCYIRMRAANNQTAHRCVTAAGVRVVVKMEPKSLELVVPLEWEVNKIKCLLISKVPTLEFGKFHFTHDGEQIPGRYSLQKVLQLDYYQQCREQERYVLTFTANKQDNAQFQLYYSLKMQEVISMTRHSPYQPLLHSGYYALRQLKGKAKFQNPLFIPNIINIDNLAPPNINNAAPPEADDAAGNAGFGLFPQAENNNNQGLFERGLGIFLRGWRLLMMVYLFNFLHAYTSLQNALVIAAVVLSYLAIGYLRKNVEHHDNEQEHMRNLGNKKEDNRYTAAVWIAKKICLSVEVMISFTMSLFPNWTIETHRGAFRAIYLQIEEKLSAGLRPSDSMAQAPSNQPQPSQQEVLVADQHEE